MGGGSGSIQGMINSLKANARLRKGKKKINHADYKSNLNLTTVAVSEEELKKIRDEIQSENKKTRKKLLIVLIVISILVVLFFLFMFENIEIKKNGY